MERWLRLAPGVDRAALASVLATMPPDLDPLEVDGFLTSPNPNLVLQDRIVTVGEYLAAGGDVEVPIWLARCMDCW